MTTLNHLPANNRKWAAGVNAEEPAFFADLAKQQVPPYCWIGCADIRVPANEVVG